LAILAKPVGKHKQRLHVNCLTLLGVHVGNDKAVENSAIAFAEVTS